jgi:hypothetical protein
MVTLFSRQDVPICAFKKANFVNCRYRTNSPHKNVNYTHLLDNPFADFKMVRYSLRKPGFRISRPSFRRAGDKSAPGDHSDL